MKNSEKDGKFDYQFNAIPARLCYLLDNDAYKLISTLIGEESYFTQANMLDKHGYFYLTTEKLSKFLFKKNRADIKNIIMTLVNSDIIFIRKSSHKNMFCFKINFDKIREIDKMDFDFILNNQIEVVKRKSNKKQTLQNVTKEQENKSEINAPLLQNVTDTCYKMSQEIVTECNINKDIINLELINKDNTYFNNKEKFSEVENEINLNLNLNNFNDNKKEDVSRPDQEYVKPFEFKKNKNENNLNNVETDIKNDSGHSDKSSIVSIKERFESYLDSGEGSISSKIIDMYKFFNKRDSIGIADVIKGEDFKYKNYNDYITNSIDNILNSEVNQVARYNSSVSESNKRRGTFDGWDK